MTTYTGVGRTIARGLGNGKAGL